MNIPRTAVSLITPLAFALSLGLVAGCSDDPEGETDAPIELDALTWEGGINELVSTECGGCHDWSQSYADVVFFIEDGELVSRAESGHQIEGANQQQLLDWIEAGYPESG